ncbi:conserved hypothetical protein [Pseudobutyrivibrio sp. YE44]|uniref:peptidoglycan editing factor PgeF n=1 Tax=Pseudobutyrivibrio sp. YE44 TaxID=1520802 RepID=UPI000885D092|nr:peptidoglycan editing factor PgeF [Pseudobutyrivibrio sp. YE44]SDB33311.1 conserved hypothetical protein [Pseudobutyrivibrio sp. YE44]
MNREINNGVTYMTFDSLKKAGVKHAFSTRLGGVSEGVFESLNLRTNSEDNVDNIHENYKRMCKALDMKYERMCFSMQTHTANVIVVEEKDAGNGITKLLPYKDVDGIITNVKDMPLVTAHADCVPLFFYDPAKQVVALSHSGWKGTVGKIGKVTVEKMTEAFGSNPEDILCGIGPSICKNCYEVSDDVAAEFEKVFGEEHKAKILSKSIFNPDDKDKYMLDLWEACRLTLLEAGILAEHIEITDYCTRCHPDLFFSHRIMGANRGGQAAFITL